MSLPRINASLLLLAVLASLTGCGRPETRIERGVREQILHIANGSEPQELDPHLVTGVTEHHLIMSMLEGLVIEDPKDLHPIPGVAERWDISSDGKVYTFYLRKNAKWSNGEPVTARDFYETYKRMLTPSLASEYAYMLHAVQNAEAFNTGKLKDFSEVGFKVLDDFTFQITLANPTSYFLSLMNHTSWFPVPVSVIAKHGPVYERGNQWTRVGNNVANGPFMLKEWRVGYKIVVQKNPHYWDAANVRLNEIHFYAIESTDAEDRSFRAGQLHIGYTVPLSKIDVYKERHPDLIHINPYLGTYFYRINVTKPPLNNKTVRRALVMAIDRETIVEKITRGGQLPAYNMTPPGTAGYTARAQLRTDFEAARKLLAEAGFPGGKGLPPIEILYNTQESHRVIAEAIQQMWKKELGVDARIVNQEWKVYMDSQRTLNYQVCRAGWIGDYVDPNNFLDMWTTGNGNNDTGWSNAEYDRLIRAAGAETDTAKRHELFQQAEAILLDECPMIPIYFYTRVRLMQPSVKGFYPTILDNHSYKFIYLEPLDKPFSRIQL
ncbi:MAG: peptide ABC transporter substrate-binding protein [Verrucomicrobiota bacterium]